MSDNQYETLSKERKALQEKDLMPQHWSTGAWQLFKAKYMYDAENPREQYERIASTLAQYVEGRYPDWWKEEFGEDYTWKQAFFDELWSGNLSGSTPVIANTGTDRGFSVSCSGNVAEDSVYGIYSAKLEVAVLTKNGFGTATYLGHIIPRGTKSSKGVTSGGVVEWIKTFVLDTTVVSQGSNRRGAWAGYLPIEHGDFFELANYLKDAPDGLNVGWNISNEFIDRLEARDPDAIKRFKQAMYTKMVTGRGYFAFIDKINARRPQMYKDLGLEVVSPQLCNEIHLHSSTDLTYTCVLSSTNVAQYDKLRKRSIFIHTVFLDCVNEDFVQKAKGIPGMEKAVKFAELGRPIGLGVCGFHTWLQKQRWPFDSHEAYAFNNELFTRLHDESLEASRWMASELGEPEWCKGHGVRNTHRTAIAPTKSSALLMGGVSEGINPDVAMTFLQLTPAGEVDRANPILLEIMKERGVNDEKHWKELTAAQGSVQNVDWLTEHEKQVFKTAFEIDQMVVLKLGAARQRKLCQGQSLNTYVSSEESEAVIAKQMAKAFRDPLILGIYYTYSKAGVAASTDAVCESCQ